MPLDKRVTGSGLRRLAWVGIALAITCGIREPRAQPTLLNKHTVFGTAGEANLFIELDGVALLNGGSLVLPPDWVLQQLSLVSRGRQLAVQWSSDRAGHYRIDFDHLGEGANHLIVGVGVPEAGSAGTMTFVPEIVSTDARAAADRPVTAALVAEQQFVDADNLVARFDAGNFLELDASDLPFFTGDGSFTLEFWIKTIGLDQIVMSSWNGSEESAYPAEVVIAADGRLLFFRGQPGQHVAMSSGDPVADGTWHHVAISHDEVRGWSRLLIDSAPHDSLVGFVGPVQAANPRFCVGSRCAARETRPGRPYSGDLDDLRIWSSARTNAQIRSTVVDRLPSVTGLVSLTFEDTPASDMILGVDRVPRVASDFLLVDPVEDLSALHDGAFVDVRWTSGGKATDHFVLERSSDGRRFSPLRTYVFEEGLGGVFTHRDELPSDPVVYYRVRQVLVNGGERLSSTVKVGLGGEELPDAASGVALANFPNPFNSITTISFEIAEAQKVSVSIWDLSGHQIASLLDGEVPAGRHEVSFAPEDLPSGSYFARLQTDAGVSTRTIILAK